MKKTLLAVLVLGTCVSSSVFAGDAGSLNIVANVASAQCKTTTIEPQTVNPTVAQLKSAEGFVGEKIDVAFESCDADDSIKVTATATSQDENIGVYLANDQAGVSTSEVSSIEYNEVKTDETGNANAGLYYKLKAKEGASSSSLAGNKNITVNLTTEYN